jgi:hypothetical protein
MAEPSTPQTSVISEMYSVVFNRYGTTVTFPSITVAWSNIKGPDGTFQSLTLSPSETVDQSNKSNTDDDQSYVRVRG